MHVLCERLPLLADETPALYVQSSLQLNLKSC